MSSHNYAKICLDLIANSVRTGNTLQAVTALERHGRVSQIGTVSQQRKFVW
jgi:hypothetical protein